MSKPAAPFAMDHFEGFCGPQALASALGVTPRAMAARLVLDNLIRSDGGLPTESVDKLLGKVVEQRPWFPKRTGRSAYPTLKQWLKEHPCRNAVVYVNAHILHVNEGRIIKDTWDHEKSLRARVEAYWPLPCPCRTPRPS